MKVENRWPPNIVTIREHMPFIDNGKPIFCYGDTIYNPHCIEVTKDLHVHESVHTRQQGSDIDGWWEKYLTDVHFRLRQELEAYGEQYHSVKDHVHGKLREWVLDKMAEALSGELYGGIISFGEARSKIRNFYR